MNISNLRDLITTGVAVKKYDPEKTPQNCVYFLCDGSGEVIYIGKATRGRIHSRIGQHNREKEFDSAYTIVIYDPSVTYVIEQGLISLYRPRLNKAITWEEFQVVRAIEYLGLHLELMPHQWTRAELQAIVKSSRENRSSKQPDLIRACVDEGKMLELDDAIDLIRDKFISKRTLPSSEVNTYRSTIRRHKNGGIGYRAMENLLNRFGFEVALVLVTRKEHSEKIRDIKESVLEKIADSIEKP